MILPVAKFISPVAESPYALSATYDHSTGRRIPGARTPQGFWVVRTGVPGHAPTDIAMVTGTPLRAMASGTVLNAGPYGECGLTVRIRHADGWVSKLCHMNQVTVGQLDLVRQGQLVGYSGNTGHSSGPHVHVAIADPNGNAVVNPLNYMGLVGTSQLALYGALGLGVAAVLGGVYWAAKEGL